LFVIVNQYLAFSGEKSEHDTVRMRKNPDIDSSGDARPAGSVSIKFWGVRGSIPSPGLDTIYYGGNTSCIEVRAGSDIIVLDAGSGVRRLGLSLMEEFKDRPIQLSLLITHTHWDHIQGFPFFLPAYDPKNKVTIYGYEGASQGLLDTFSGQMERPYFPVSLRQMPGHLVVRELREMDFKLNQVAVRAKVLNHPGVCTGYRLFTPGGSICYLPDVELCQRLRGLGQGGGTATAEDQSMVEFIRDSEVLIVDSQYDAAEYEKHIGWGHSCMEDSVAFAMRANVKRLFLFHHDPDHTDRQVRDMEARARQIAAGQGSGMVIEAAREGHKLILGAKAKRAFRD